MNQPFEDAGNKNIIETVYYKFIYISHQILLNLKKNLLLFLLCIAVPCILLIAKNFAKPTRYSGTFTIMYDDMPRKIYGDRIEKINMLIQSEQYNKVGQLLGIKPALAEKLQEIQAKNILGEDLTKDMNTDRIPFVVTIISADSAGLNLIQDHLVDFLETGTQFLASKKAIKDLEIENELAFVNRQLNLIDSLERKVNLSTAMNSAENSKDGKGANSIYESSYELYRKKQDLERRKSLPTTLHIIDDIIAPVKVKPSLASALVKGMAIGIFFYVVLVLFLIPVFRYRDAKNL